MRTHLILPEELLREIDSLVGRRKRSRFVEKAVREKLKREKLISALEKTAGVLSPEEHPEWATLDKVAEWVKESRQRDEARLRRLSRG